MHIDKTHFKKDSPKNTHKKQLKLLKKKKPPEICPHCPKGIHWARKFQSKCDIVRKPILENSKLWTSQVPSTKNQGQTPFSPSNPRHLTMLPSIYQP